MILRLAVGKSSESSNSNSPSHDESDEEDKPRAKHQVKKTALVGNTTMKARPSTQPPSSSYLLSRGRFASLLVLLFRVGLCLTCVSPRPVVARGDSLPDDKNDMSIEEATAGDNGANASCSLTMRPKDLSPELVYEILDYKGIFADVEEEEVCRLLATELTPVDQETAARTSYAYWWWEKEQATTETANDEVDRLRLAAAMREARRHYVGVGRDVTKAAVSLQEALRLRTEHQIDLLRWIGQPEHETQSLSVADQDRLALYREYIVDELGKQMMAVVGLDEENRAVVVKGSRTNSDTAIEAYFIMQVYASERAIALTEVASRGKQEHLFVIFDFAAYRSQDAPPTLPLRGALADLQKIYKERLHQLVILDPPFFLNLIYTIISPFLDATTREKVDMVSGQSRRHQLVTASPERQGALSFLLLPEEAADYGVKVDTFLKKVSFHDFYDLSASIPVTVVS